MFGHLGIPGGSLKLRSARHELGNGGMIVKPDYPVAMTDKACID